MAPGLYRTLDHWSVRKIDNSGWQVFDDQGREVGNRWPNSRDARSAAEIAREA